MSLPAFSWLSVEPDPPARWDLRHLGWDLDRTPAGAARGLFASPMLLDWRSGHRRADWRAHRVAPLIVAVGVDEAQARASLIAAGFGDALPTAVALVELAARLLKLDGAGPRIPRERRAGPLTLDLFHRDARLAGRWLGLHPREFALLWRLAETPFRRVSKPDLLADVWRLDRVPETNSLEVHVSRLRTKLACKGLGWLVQTCPEGGYRLGREGGSGFGAFSLARREVLDSVGTMGKSGSAAFAAAIEPVREQDCHGFFEPRRD